MTIYEEQDKIIMDKYGNKNPTELPPPMKVEITNHPEQKSMEETYYDLIDNLNHPDEPLSSDDIKSFEEDKNA